MCNNDLYQKKKKMMRERKVWLFMVYGYSCILS
jgi:hypothetical protein